MASVHPRAHPKGGKHKNITPKQAKFVELYLENPNLSVGECMKRAGYSSGHIRTQSTEIMQKTAVSEAIREGLQERGERMKLRGDQVLEELRLVAFSDITEYVDFRTEKQIVDHDSDGEPIYEYRHVMELKPSHKINGRMIKQIQINGDRVKFEMYDKMKALELLSKHFGLLLEPESDPKEFNIHLGIAGVDDNDTENQTG